jgi:photosystem II stability/assembly factor-like uncharacterized protein
MVVIMKTLRKWIVPALLALTGLGVHAQSVWTQRRLSPLPTYLKSVTWTGTQIVVVGENGSIQTSHDGGTWNTRFVGGLLSDLSAVHWTGKQIVAVGNEGSVLTSPDTINWVAQNSGTTSDLYPSHPKTPCSPRWVIAAPSSLRRMA